MRPEIVAWLNVLTSQIGVEEVRTGGGNHGAQIDAYLRAAHLTNPVPPRPGYAWCDALLAWCADEAERQYNLQIPLLRTAGCDVSLAWARQHDILFSAPQPGDQMLVMASRYDATHTGAVTAIDAGGKSFSTIEGNTNRDGGREGYTVARDPLGHPRPVSSRYLFARWSLLLPPEVEAAPLSYALVMAGKKLADMPVQGGNALAPARVVGESCGFKVGWDPEAQVVAFNDVPVPEQVTWIANAAWLPVRKLAAAVGLSVVVDNARRIVTLVQGGVNS